MIQKIFIWTSPLPLLLFWGLSIYVNQYEGWGQWAAGIILLIPVLLSLVMGVMGVVLIVCAKKKQEPVANLWVSTAMAASVFLYFLVKAISQEFFTSFG